MKIKLITLSIMLFLIFGCGYTETKEDHISWVKSSLSEDISKDPMYNGITIKDVVLVKESINKFSGWVEFTDGVDTEKSQLDVTVDGESKIYNCAPPMSLLNKN